MNQTISSSKTELRQEASRQRAALSESYRRQADAAICRRLRALPELDGCRLLAAFVAFGPEPDLTSYRNGFTATGGRLFLPRSRRDGDGSMQYELAAVTDPSRELVEGAFGIMEPAPHLPAAAGADRENMYWLVPGVAFDPHCRRLGRGKGFYDRLLSRGHGLKIGIFYECQKLTAVPVEAHDRPLDVIVTETAVYRPKPSITEI